MNRSQDASGGAAMESRRVFFRQGGWLILATTVSGGCMLATQMVAQRWMNEHEYTVFFALLRVYLLLGIPSIGLQTVFAQQAAAAVTPGQQAGLAAGVRSVLRMTSLVWLVAAGAAWLAGSWLMATMGITNPLALWATVAMGLGCLWGPVVRGVLQGRQHFAGLGMVLILDGACRLAGVTLLLMAGGQAAGGMGGALLGLGVSTLLCAWMVRDVVVRGPAGGFDWVPWLRRVAPITLGAGAVLVFTTADVIFVQSVFTREARELYMPSAMVGLGITMYAMPLAQVMFPKVARSMAVQGRSRVMPLALLVTAGGVALGAVACTLFPSLPLRMVFFSKPAFWAAAPLVPWYAWVVVPLALANVLINNLLAQERFRIVPWVALVGLLYLGALFALRHWLPTLPPLAACRALLVLLGGCNLLLLAIGVMFTGRAPAPTAVGVPSI